MNTADEGDPLMFKIIIVGNSHTGKTSISTRYVKDTFQQQHKATIGVEMVSKVIQLRKKDIKLTIWDTAGQQRFRSTNKSYFRGVLGALFVYDITDAQSYLDLLSWMKIAHQSVNLQETVFFVVGNKYDLKNERSVEEFRPLKQYKQKFDIQCWEVSAKTGYNIDKMFISLAQSIYKLLFQSYRSSIPFIQSSLDPVLPPIQQKKEQIPVTVTTNNSQNMPIRFTKNRHTKLQPKLEKEKASRKRSCC